MRLSALILVPLLAAGVFSVGCRHREEPPPPAPPAPVKPATGWTSEITGSAAGALVEALTSDGWVTKFRETNGRMPVIEVVQFEDRSGDHVPVDEVAAEFVRLLGTNDRVLAATAGQVSDVTLTGVIGLRAASAAQEFTIDARVTERRSGDAAWVAGITRPRP